MEPLIIITLILLGTAAATLVSDLIIDAVFTRMERRKAMAKIICEKNRKKSVSLFDGGG